MDGPKTLILDIENSPVLADVWALFKQYVSLDQIRRDWIMLSWAAKWHGEESVYSDTLFRHKKVYREDPENDGEILQTLNKLLCAADVVVGHNSNRFDLPKIRARMIINGLTPFPAVQEVDTLKIAKHQFRFTSNKLAYIAKALGVGDKLDTGGHLLWQKCMRGDKESWRLMEEYNRQDVVLTEQVYDKLAPWSKSHPNFGLYRDDDVKCCTVCGSENVYRDGHAYTQTGKFQRYKCGDCGKYLRSRKNVKDRDNLLTNVM